MFWRRRNETPERDAGPAKPVDAALEEKGPESGLDLQPVHAEDVLDWLAEAMRIYGEHAFDTSNASGEQTRETCETWARHLLLGVRAPDCGSDERAGSAADDPASDGPRDWPGLRLYLSDHRQKESEYVRESQTNLREAIWAFISGIRRSMLREQRGDDQINHRIHRLEGALAQDDHEAIKWEAQETIGLITELMSDRREEHRTEMAELGDRLERMRGELDSVRQEAANDSLTKLYNRAAFDEQLQRVLDFANLFEKPAFLVMLDIDHFKWVNDNHGHLIGDQVLKHVATSLARSFLRRDDFVARYGGEEFAVLLRGGDLATAENLSEHALSAIRELEIEGRGEPVRVTASAGVAQLQPENSPDQWVEAADRALYAAKNAGRDQIVVSDSNSK